MGGRIRRALLSGRMDGCKLLRLGRALEDDLAEFRVHFLLAFADARQRGRFSFAAKAGSFRRMSTITAILEADADGTLHLPLPAELRHGKIKVEAKLEAVEGGSGAARAPRQKLTATPEMIEQRMAALERVRKLNPYRDIADPVAWQREMREDVKLPGRE